MKHFTITQVERHIVKAMIKIIADTFPINAVIYARINATNSVGTSEWSDNNRGGNLAQLINAKY